MRTNAQQSVFTDCCVLFLLHSLDNLSKYYSENEYVEKGQVTATRNLSNGVSHAYTYSYSDNAARTLSEIGIKGLSIRPKQDVNGRASEKTVSDTTGVLAGEYYNYAKYGDHATNRISTIRYGARKDGKYSIGEGIKYVYDRMGNISKVYENGALLASYTYDGVNRLIREDNKKLNKTVIFTYDNNGNILAKNKRNATASH